MLRKSGKLNWRTGYIILIFSVLAICLSIIAFMLSMVISEPPETQTQTQTDIEVRATVGNPAENKLGGIEFEVLGRWGYDENDRIIFHAYFDQGLELNKVICLLYHDGKYIKRDYREWEPTWKTWLERYQEVLVGATTGELQVKKARI